MADTLVKNPKLIVGTQAQVSAEMGQNDIGFATDIEFYTAKQIDELLEKSGGASLPILMPTWSDHLLNDVSWLRADTFSWQSGDVYVAAYEHLVMDFESRVGRNVVLCGWGSDSDPAYTMSELPKTGEIVYKVSGDSITAVGTVRKDTQEGGSLAYTTGSSNVSLTRHPEYDKTVMVYELFDTIGDITITYYLAQDGHKICLPDQESNIVELYEKTGAANYYLLDTTNKQFKLPRKQKRKLIQAVKNTDGTWYNLYSDGWVEQGGTASYNSSSVTFPVEFADTEYYFNANLDNGGTGTTLHTISSSYTTVGCVLKEGQDGVAQRALTANAKWFACGYAAESAYASAGMNLEYYYVGNFTQEAVEQTAGITTETLNGKADADLGNINASQSAKETIVGWGMPDYSAGVVVANGTHTATVDGIIVVSVVVSSGESTWNITIDNESFDFYQGYHGTDYNHITNGFLPIPKGAVYTITTTNCQARFYPLKGVK